MHLSLISEHASPLAALGGTDSGGQNVYVAKTASLLASKGHTVDVYTRRSDPSQAQTVTLKPGLRVIHVDAGPAEAIAKEDICDFMPQFAQQVIARMREEGAPDLVHAHFWMSGLVAMEIKRALGVPFVITFHALGKVRRIHQGDADRFPEWRSTAEQQIVAEAERVLAECPQDVADLKEHYSAPFEKLVQVPCGVDPDEIAPVDKALARELLGIDERARVVLQLGRMVPRKGVDDAIRGFARAACESATPSLMLVVGGEVPDESFVETAEGARLLRIATEEGVQDRVRFTGSRSRGALRYFYSAADVFVSTPWYEPFGITPLESMACGTPVIGSRVGGIKHTVKDGRTGLLVEPHDPDAVSTAIRVLLSSDQTRVRMGMAGIERVRSLFTWEKVTQSLESVYLTSMDPARRGQPRVVHKPPAQRQADFVTALAKEYLA